MWRLMVAAVSAPSDFVFSFVGSFFPEKGFGRLGVWGSVARVADFQLQELGFLVLDNISGAKPCNNERNGNTTSNPKP